MLNTAVNSGATNTSDGLRTYLANFIYSSAAPGFGGGSIGIYYSSTANGGILPTSLKLLMTEYYPQ